MSNQKGSYFQKHLQKQNDGVSELRMPAIRVSITSETKAKFEAGQVILIDKPLHWTSFDAVRKIRGTIGIKKVGHAGTLDPLATGLLIICTGKFTKKINEYMAQEKEYTGSFTLGATTPTYDLESNPENHQNISAITEEMIQKNVVHFQGSIMQKPPIYAAIKKKGTPLYELARRGEEVELEPRPVKIVSFEITNIQLPVIDFRIRCSTGTYIRSIAHDFGQLLGCGAYLSGLRRTAIGAFKVEEAETIESFLLRIQHQNA